MRFFHVKFLNAPGSLAQKNIYNACAIFRQFSDVQNGGRSQQPNVVGDIFMIDFSRKSSVNYKRQVNTYLVLNISRCQYYLNGSVILNIEVKTFSSKEFF